LHAAHATLALAESGNFLHAPDIYMDKIAVGPGLPDGVVNLDDSVAHNLRNLVSSLRRRFKKEATILGQFSVAEENVLRALFEKDEMSPSELCTRLALSSQFMSQVLNHLEEMDYITRRPSKEDKRKTLVSFSKNGRKKIEDTRRQREEWLASVIAKQYSAQQKEVIKEAAALLKILADL